MEEKLVEEDGKEEKDVEKRSFRNDRGRTLGVRRERACVRARTRGPLNGATTGVVIFCRGADGDRAPTEDTVVVRFIAASAVAVAATAATAAAGGAGVAVTVALAGFATVAPAAGAAFPSVDAAAGTAAIAVAVAVAGAIRTPRHAVLMFAAPRDRFRVDVFSLAPNQRRHNTVEATRSFSFASKVRAPPFSARMMENKKGKVREPER